MADQQNTRLNTINQQDRKAIYRTFTPMTTKHILQSSAHRTFSRINHKQVSRSLKGLKSLTAMLSDQNGIKLEITNKKI